MKPIKAVKFLEGRWGNDIKWEFYYSSFLPERKKCTAVFCVPISNDENAILINTKRGWEFPGGHIEKGETIEKALIRETIEESGVELKYFELIGYRKIITKNPLINKATGKPYPFPISYIPHYVGYIDSIKDFSEKDEVIEVRKVSLLQLDTINLRDGDDKMVIEAFKAYNLKNKFCKSNLF